MTHDTFDDIAALIQKNDTYRVSFEVHGDTVGAFGEHNKFTRDTVFQAAYLGNAIADREDLTDLLHFGCFCKIRKDLFSLFFLFG